MTKICEYWKCRKLALKAKIIVLNVLVYPIIYYLVCNRFCSDEVITKVKGLTTSFMWNGNTSKIAYETLTLPINEGDLGLHNFKIRIQAARLAWVRRILTFKSGFWIEYVQKIFGTTSVLDIFLKKKVVSLRSVPLFYARIVKEWQKIYTDRPDTEISCRHEPIWNNRMINLRSLSKLQLIWKNKGINRINDVLDKGIFFTSETFQRKYGIQHGQNLLDKLYSYIPGDILQHISPQQMLLKPVGLFIKDAKGVMTDVIKISTKEFYEIIIKKLKIVPRAKIKWQEHFADDHIVQTEGAWRFWYHMPYGCTREVKLQSFHYRVLNRTLPCNEYLNRIKIRDVSKCSYCDEENDDSIHFLFECDRTSVFWNELVTWLIQFDNLLNIPEEVLEYDFLFGTPSHSLKDRRMNYIFLLGKFYVYRQKIFHNNNLNVYEFMVEFKNTLVYEKIACLKEGSMNKKFKKTWEELFDRL